MTSGRVALVALAVALTLVGSPLGARAVNPPTVGGDPRVDPADFEVTVFAEGLDFPFGLQQLADGSFLVGSTAPNAPGGYLSNSTDTVLRLVDADDDGVAYGPGTALYAGLPGPVTSVRVAGALVFVASGPTGAPRIFVFRTGATPALPLSLEGSIDFAYPLP